jgi:hypothetical protein
MGGAFRAAHFCRSPNGPPIEKDTSMLDDIPPRRREAAKRTADSAFKTWETRTQLVKNELAAASAANDAKTARLRALRLEKERQDAEAAKAQAPAAPAVKKKPVRRIAG